MPNNVSCNPDSPDFFRRTFLQAVELAANRKDWTEKIDEVHGLKRPSGTRQENKEILSIDFKKRFYGRESGPFHFPSPRIVCVEADGTSPHYAWVLMKSSDSRISYLTAASLDYRTTGELIKSGLLNVQLLPVICR